ncbi:MAG: phosphoribosyltransferase family protein [Candidatus Nanopelagicaceae bacterium]|nr:phosphoribosyltransferase family protein [Candidatus Nanopelagicaceae bacterium]
MIFNNRTDAGRALGERLEYLQGQDVIVLGLPRGGVPVAREVSKAIHAPLDVIVVRKLGVPTQPELAMGAVGEGGVLITNDEILRMIQISPEEFAQVQKREANEVKIRALKFRSGNPPKSLNGRIALIVDDGIATGSTAQAACKVARTMGASKIILAVPVGSKEATSALKKDADEVVCLETPENFFAVGEWYRDFASVSDEEVIDLLHTELTNDVASKEESVSIDLGEHTLPGQLTIPEHTTGLVIFAHGSGSSRLSPRNQFVAKALNSIGLATLLFDLLDSSEESNRENIFNIEFLAERLTKATLWAKRDSRVGTLPLGYFGASTGAAAALWAASDPELKIRAIVSRGGRPDLAAPKLSEVLTPTLLIVGGNDDEVIQLNQQAQRELRCENQLVTVPGATHLFEEPGTLEQVADLAGKWFLTHP